MHGPPASPAATPLQVRSTGRERFSGQIDAALSDLGRIPPADKPNSRALWVAGLINPVPALGLAIEVRSEALMAIDAESRLRAVEVALSDSIRRLQRIEGVRQGLEGMDI